MTLVHNFITLKVTLSPQFVTHYHQIYQRGSHLNFCDGSDINARHLHLVW